MSKPVTKATRAELLCLAGFCPWCESTEVWLWDKAIPGKFAVACSNPSCAAIGPFGNNEAQAIARWNVAPRRKPGTIPERLRRIVEELQPSPGERDFLVPPASGEWTPPEDG